MSVADDCDCGRLGATVGAGVFASSCLGVSGARPSAGRTASKSESCVGADKEECFIQVA
jgi:hypothetical protein